METERDRARAQLAAMRDGDDFLHNTQIQQALDWALWVLAGPVLARSDELYAGLDAIDELSSVQADLQTAQEAVKVLVADRLRLEALEKSHAKCRADFEKARNELRAERRSRRRIEKSRASWKAKATGRSENRGRVKTKPPRRPRPMESRAALRLVVGNGKTPPTN